MSQLEKYAETIRRNRRERAEHAYASFVANEPHLTESDRTALRVLQRWLVSDGYQEGAAGAHEVIGIYIGDDLADRFVREIEAAAR